MKVLFYCESLGGNTTSFINRQIEDVSKIFKTLTLTKTPLDERSDLNYDVKQVDFSPTNKLLHRLEISDIYFSKKDKKLRKFLKKEIEGFKPDIIHCQFGYDALDILENTKNLNIPIIIQFRGYDASTKLELKKYRNRISYYLNQKRIHSLFVCQHLIKNLKSYGVTFANEPKVLYSNTDTDFFKPSKKEKDNIFTFVQISSFKEKKGHKYTILAFKKLLDDFPEIKAQLLLTGKDGATYQESIVLIDNLNLNKHISLIGWVNRNEAKKLLEISHVGIQHSITDRFGDQEGIPNFLMEAMAMELPIISTLHAGIPELLTEDTNAILIDEKDVNSYSNAMKHYYDNWKFSLSNREQIISNFSRTEHTNKLIKIYTTLKNEYFGNS